MVSFQKVFSGKRFVCCALTVYNIIYNMLSRSIASIYELSTHIYLGTSCLGKYGAAVVFINYGPPYIYLCLPMPTHAYLCLSVSIYLEALCQLSELN